MEREWGQGNQHRNRERERGIGESTQELRGSGDRGMNLEIDKGGQRNQLRIEEGVGIGGQLSG